MDGMRLIAIVLLIAGTLALVYGGFTYTEDRDSAELGPLEVAVEDKETVNIPVWAGVGAIVVGGLMLLGAGRKR